MAGGSINLSRIRSGDVLGYCTRRAKRVWQRLFVKLGPVALGEIRCREITPVDLDDVINLLTKGFWRQPREYWLNIINRLKAHQTPEGFPKYGYMLTNNGTPVGVLLLIFTARMVNGVTNVWCSESSYYVDPQFRPYALLLVKRSHQWKGVTYLNLTASSHTWATLKVQGYKRLTQGVYVSIPALCRAVSKVRVHRMALTFAGRLEPFDVQLLMTHANYKRCISLVCEHDGKFYPFVFAVRYRYSVPFAYLVYSKDQIDFVQFARAIGRFLAKHGILFIAIDADGPIAGLPGKLTTLLPKWWTGPMRPRLGDLAYTEIPMFGVI